MSTPSTSFPGFPPAPATNFWPYPLALDRYWKYISPSEHKVLDYILRRTWGFRKNEDSIAISQFIGGITKRDGTILDEGCGIKNEKTIRKALDALVAKGYIIRDKDNGRPDIFQLRTDPSQSLVPLLPFGTTPPPKNGKNPTQDLVPTKESKTIESNNIEQSLVHYLSERLGGCKFPMIKRQYTAVQAMVREGFSEDDIKWAIDRLYEIEWWRQHSFDMVNVANEIGKLMTREYRVDETT